MHKMSEGEKLYVEAMTRKILPTTKSKVGFQWRSIALGVKLLLAKCWTR